MFLTDDVKITKVSVATAAGVTTIDSSPVDMSGYDGVVFLTTVLAITAGAGTSMKAQQDVVVGMGGAADLTGTGITIADDDDNQSFWLDIQRPVERFVRCRILRATQNSAFGEIYAIQYRARTRPQNNNVVDTITGEKWGSPIEGTA
jgi:hypothetical protein